MAAPYFTVAEARKLPDLDDATKVTDAAIDAERVGAESDLEDACGLAFVPRVDTERLDGPGGPLLRLGHRRVRAIQTVAILGQALSTGELAALEVSATGLVRRHGGWPSALGSIQVTYEHGLDAPPFRGKRAAMLLVRDRLVNGPIDDRAYQIAGEFGPISLVTPGVRGSVFGIPEVDSFVRDAKRGWVIG